MPCLILSTGRKPVSKEHLENCYKNNHSVGVIFIENGEFKMRKAGTNFENFHKFYLERGCQHENIVFFQSSPDKTYDKDYCKPFLISPNVYLVVDGLPLANYDNIIDRNGNESIVQQFVKKIIRPIARINEQIFKSGAFFPFLLKSLGQNCRLLFFYRNGENFIYNMSNGDLDSANNTWYSNHSYKYTYNGKQTYFYPPKTQNRIIRDEEDIDEYLELGINQDVIDLIEEEKELARLEFYKERKRGRERRLKHFSELSDAEFGQEMADIEELMDERERGGFDMDDGRNQLFI